jgi:hypothetical protein
VLGQRFLSRLDVQERLEASRTGRILINAFLIVTLVAVVITNLPESELRHEALKAAKPYLNGLGLDQVWSVFAPDPRRVSIDLEARVKFKDGTTATWRPPQGGDVLGAYWDYRWRKWMENVIQDANRERLWHATAVYVARQEREGGRVPASVTLVRRWQQLKPPGRPGSDRRPWKSYAYYKLRLPTAPPNGGGTG